jgi:site-specific DNA recombinase
MLINLIIKVYKYEMMKKDSIIENIHVHPAAIWARVSTQGQAETSLPAQISRCKTKLEEAGYSLTHTLSADWSSLDLFSCPEFQQLLNLIRNHKIKAIAILDRDRLEAQGLQRLIFMSECKEAGIKLEICQGPPVLDEPEGQIIELVLAIGKERSVIRARQGSKDGLHDRAVKSRKPVTYHKLYGYQWDKTNDTLIPNDNWDNLKLIFNMLLDGKGYHRIIEELIRRGIPSPSGQPNWNKTVLSNIAHNPAYAGRYYALKKTAVEPLKRRGKTYGNSSTRLLPLEKAHYISEIKIVAPPITWEQRRIILNQLAQHQKLAQRNAKRDYLLRGFILCGTHTGKNGEPRRYHGQPNNHNKNRWRYTCPVGGCPHPSLDGFSLEKEVKEHVWQLLDQNLDKVSKLMDVSVKTEESIRREIFSI